MYYSIRKSFNQNVSGIETDTNAPNTYSISTIRRKRQSFYDDLSDFTDHFFIILQTITHEYVDAFSEHIQVLSVEPFRSKNEYTLELLITGVLWDEYSYDAQKSSIISLSTVSFLHAIRSFHPIVKFFSDTIRGYLLNNLLHAKTNSHIEPSLKSLHSLIQWLKATGEFIEEAKRMQKWYSFIATLTPEKQKQILIDCSALAGIFRSAAQSFLGTYTDHVDSFIQQIPHRNRNKENRIFCGRREIEYHMNMFAAEVMNRQFREEFINRKNKVVLLPTCMKQQKHNPCKAYNDGKTFICAHCNTSCNIHLVSKKLAKNGVQCSLVPHSSDFTRFLKRWQSSKDTALVGVACVLNLLRGGLEMRRLSIASQCVFLDFSGCKKHWHSTGIPTSLQLTQLYKILGIHETA
jgi:uncharacterized protein